VRLCQQPMWRELGQMVRDLMQRALHTQRKELAAQVTGATECAARPRRKKPARATGSGGSQHCTARCHRVAELLIRQSAWLAQ